MGTHKIITIGFKLITELGGVVKGRNDLLTIQTNCYLGTRTTWTTHITRDLKIILVSWCWLGMCLAGYCFSSEVTCLLFKMYTLVTSGIFNYSS